VATWNEQLQDEIIQRQTDLMRLASAKGAELIAILDETDAAIKALLLDIDSAGGVTADQFAAIRAVQQRIAEIRAEAWGQIELQLQRDAEEIAIVAADGSRAAVIAATSGEIVPAVVSGQALLSIAATRPFEGRLLSEWAAKMRDDDISRLSKAIQLGMVRGQNPVQIAKDIYEAGGVADISRNGLAALVRTATNHIGNEAAALFAAQNPYIKRERYAATLDARTTLVCAGLDGQVFDVGEGPRPPLHYQCRSTRVPFIDAAYLGQRPAVDATQAGARRAYIEAGEPADGFDKFRKKYFRERTGPIPAETTYQQWLSRRSAQMQDDILGPTRGKLFRAGGLRIDQFTAANGRTLTLDELRKRHADAFRRANID